MIEYLDIPQPTNIKSLRRDHVGRPVPWFVHWEDGKPDFRIIAEGKRRDAVRFDLCWVCGRRKGRWHAFLIGPMCTVNRTTAEPPAHRECAEYAAKACPFLSRPNMTRRTTGIPEEAHVPGVMVERNPGALVIYTTPTYKIFKTPTGELFELGEPTGLSWWAHGRPATREEVQEAIDSGMPLLRDTAEQGGPSDVASLDQYYDRAMASIDRLWKQ